MRKLILFFAFLFSTTSLFAQQPLDVNWVDFYAGGDSIQDVGLAVDADNCIFVAGEEYNNATQNDIVLMKFSPNGQREWVKTIDKNNKYERFTKIHIGKECSIIVAYTSSDFNLNTATTIVAKYDSLGNNLWSYEYDSGNSSLMVQGFDMEIDNNDNISVVGNISSTVANSSMPNFAFQLSEAGSLLWQTQWSGNNLIYNYPTDLTLDSNGNLLIAANGYGSGTTYSLIYKVNLNGNFIWETVLNSSLNGQKQIKKVGYSSNKIYAAGSSSNNGSGTIEFYICDNSGNITNSWAYSDPNSISSDLQDWLFDSQGNILLTGSAESNTSSYDVLIMKYDSQGNVLWQQKFDGPTGGKDSGRKIKMEANGNIVVGGTTSSVTGSDFTVLRYDANGTFIDTMVYTTPGGFTKDNLGDLSVRSTNEIYVTGAAAAQNGGPVSIVTVKFGLPVSCNIIANAGNDVKIFKGEKAYLGDAPAAGLTYSWYPATDLDNSNISYPFSETEDSISYILTVSNGTGCAALDTVTVIIKSAPSTIDTNFATCGLNGDFILNHNSNSFKYRSELQRSLYTNNTNSTLTCGRFKLFFEDDVLQNGNGFNSSSGTPFKQCACDAINYIQSIFDIPAGDGSLIEIQFGASWYGGNNPYPNTVALGGPTFNYPSSGFYGGDVFDHMTTGNNTTPNTYDGIIIFNFNFTFAYCNAAPSCSGQLDFYSVVLHEFTHTLGWISLLDEDATSAHYPKSLPGNDRYSLLDKSFLFAGTINGTSLTQIVNGTNINSPFINSGLPNNIFRFGPNSSGTGVVNGIMDLPLLWHRNILMDDQNNNQNTAGSLMDGQSGVENANQAASHYYDFQSTYDFAANFAPGFTPNYVMGPAIHYGQRKRTFTNQELRNLNTLGYNFKSTFLSSSTINTNYTNQAIIQNVHPYTTKNVFDYQNQYWNPNGRYVMDNTLADYSITNCQSRTIDLSGDPAIHDANTGDKMYVFPGSLFNLRGCGSGGNNHSNLQIVTTSNGDQIIYTPDPNFIGRAQFAFHLYDGKERGAYIIYTIDVTACNACPVSVNMIINGDFEEGTETKLTTNNSSEYSGINYYRNGKLYYPCPHMSNGIVFGLNQTIIRNSAGCLNGDVFGFPSYSFPGSSNPLPVNNVGDRYILLNNGVYSYQILCSAPAKCKKYRIEFDINTISNVPMVIGVTDNPVVYPNVPQVYNQVNINVSNSAGTWQHISQDFYYCDNNSGTYIAIGNSAQSVFYIDNIVLKEISPDPPLTATISSALSSASCTNNQYALQTNITNPRCNLTYSWTPTTGLSNANIANPIATITTNTVYNVMVSDGCNSATSSVTLNFNNPTNITPIVQSSSSCANIANGTGSVTSVTGGTSPYTYLWSATANNQTMQTATNLASGIHSVSVTDANGCSGTTSVTIGTLASPTFTLTASPAAICTGSSTTITASGSHINFSWNTNPVQTTTSITVSPTTTTTYTVIGTSTNGCASSNTITITVNPPPNISATASPSIVCANTGTIQLTASPSGINNTFVWSTGNTGNQVNIVPTAVNAIQTYSVTVTNQNGCTAQAQTNVVSVQNCDCNISGATALTNYNIVAPINLSYAASNSFMVNNHLNFIGNGLTKITNGIFYIAKGVIITVKTGVNLELNNVHFLSCGDMWAGIVVEPGATIRINNCLIEDAEMAVSIAGSGGTTNRLTCYNTCFNRNLVAIDVVNSQTTTYPYSIENTVFTSRSFNNYTSWPLAYPIVWPRNHTGVNPLKTQNTPTNPLAAPYNVGSYTTANLKAPHSNTKAQIGIRLRSVGSTQNGTNTNTFYGITIGRSTAASGTGTTNSQLFNLFDNLYFGISAVNANLTSINNVFQNINSIPQSATLDCAGIYAAVKGSTRFNVDAIKVGNFKNLFYDCQQAVQLNNYYSCNISETNIRSTQVYNGGNGFRRGENGINVRTARYNNLNINSNTITNITNGIIFFADGVYNGATYAQEVGKSNINSNIIQNQIQGNTVTNEFVRVAITVDNVINGINNIGNVTTNNGSFTSVKDNYIYGAFNGIFSQNLQNPSIIISTNYVGIALQPPKAGTAWRQIGIEAINTAKGSIYDNNVDGPGFSNQNIRGITTSMNSGGISVTCNQVQKFERGFEFNTSQIGTVWRNNNMQQCKQAFVLDNNGVIGDQGAANAPMDNKWSPVAWPSGNYKTMTYGTGSSALTSRFYVRSAALFNPAGGLSINNTTGNPGFDNYSTTPPPPPPTLPPSIVTGASGATTTCPALPAGQSTGCNGCIAANGNGNLLRLIINDSLNYDFDTLLVRQAAKLQLFKNLAADVANIPNDAVIQDFYTSNLTSNKQKILTVETKLKQKDFAGAEMELNNIQAPSVTEDKYRLLHQMYLSYARDSIMPDSIGLMNLANLCPFEYGEAVYQARSFYNLVNNTNILFDDNCVTQSITRIGNISNEIKEQLFEDKKTVMVDTENIFDFELYPNPNNTEKLSIKLNQPLENFNISIEDVIGGKVFEKAVVKNDNIIVEINLSNFAGGTYFISVKNSDGKQLTKRLIVNK